MYADQQLAPSSWAKALAWAVSLESARARAADAEAAAADASSTSAAAKLPPSVVAESDSGDNMLMAQQHTQASVGKAASHDIGQPHIKPAGQGARVAATNGVLRCLSCECLHMYPHANPTSLQASLPVHCRLPTLLLCRRSASASNASGAFLLPDRQPLSPLHGPATTGSPPSIAQPLSLLTGLAARVLGLGQPSAATAEAQPSTGAARVHRPAGGSDGTELVLRSPPAAADSTRAADGQEPASSVLSLTKAGKQHIGQLVVSEVRSRTHDSSMQDSSSRVVVCWHAPPGSNASVHCCGKA